MKLRVALHAAQLGWPVLLLHGIEEDGSCTCGDPNCPHRGKHPLTPHGSRTRRSTRIRFVGCSKSILRPTGESQLAKKASGRKSGNRYLYLHGKTPKKVSLPPLPEALVRVIEGRSSSLPQSELLIPQGKRNATLASLAGATRRLGMTRHGIEAGLLEENRCVVIHRCPMPK
jgi:hypothetical protein